MTIKKLAIIAICWIALVIGAGITHTNVILADKITPAQDEAISATYCELAGIGVGVLIGVFLVSKFFPTKPRK